MERYTVLQSWSINPQFEVLQIWLQVHLIEACLFPLFYLAYVSVVISMSYFRVRTSNHYCLSMSERSTWYSLSHLQAWWKKKKHSVADSVNDDSDHLVERMNKLETSNPTVVAATFTHSVLIESMSYSSLYVCSTCNYLMTCITFVQILSQSLILWIKIMTVRSNC